MLYNLSIFNFLKIYWPNSSLLKQTTNFYQQIEYVLLTRGEEVVDEAVK